MLEGVLVEEGLDGPDLLRRSRTLLSDLCWFKPDTPDLLEEEAELPSLPAEEVLDRDTVAVTEKKMDWVRSIAQKMHKID